MTRSFKVGRLFRLYRDATFQSYRLKIWCEPGGDLSWASTVPDTPAGRKRLARLLREAAKWVEKP